jgi:multidrug efflux pump subunit AcrA (membrane-fusion protein)
MNIKLIYTIIAFPITTILPSCGKKTMTTQPVRKDITELVFATGVLKADNEYSLTAQAEGYITAIYFEEGDEFMAGKVMAVIDNKQSAVNAAQSDKLLKIAKSNAAASSPLFQQVKANLAAATEKVTQDEQQVERYRKLLESNSIAKVEYENMKLILFNSHAAVKVLEEQYNNLQVQADQQVEIQKQQSGVNNSIVNYNRVVTVVGGKVYKKRKQLGDYVRKGDVIAEIGNPSKIYAYLSIDESNIAKIKIRQPVIIQFNTHKDINYDGVVTEIYPSFDEQTQSFYCRTEFTKEPEFKISGTQLQGNIIIGNKRNILVVPRNFLKYGNKVRIKGKGDIIVETGFISNDWVEILKGLDENIIIEADKTK